MNNFHKKQIIGTPSTQKISYLYSKLTSEPPSLILQPSFQRRLVWSDNHKEKFIETLLLGFPSPEIYIAQTGIDVETITSQEVIVDGQQRLSTIIEYIMESEDSNVFGNIVTKYKKLSKEQKEKFLNYNIIVRDLGDIGTDQIREIFSRINSTSYALKAIEINNALYDGEFINTAHELMEENNIKDLPFLSETSISRMEDLNYILLLMATIINNGYFALSTKIEDYIYDYNNNFNDKDKIKTNFVKTLDIINKLDLENDSIWYRKSNYFTLFIEINKVLDQINDKNMVKIEKNIKELEKKIVNSKDAENDNEFKEYYNMMYSGTNSRKARVIRGKLVEEFLKKSL